MTLNAVLDDSGTKELNLGTHKELNLSASTGNMTLQYTIVMMVETIVSHVLVCENGTKNTIYIAFIYNININVGT